MIRGAPSSPPRSRISLVLLDHLRSLRKMRVVFRDPREFGGVCLVLSSRSFWGEEEECRLLVVQGERYFNAYGYFPGPDHFPPSFDNLSGVIPPPHTHTHTTHTHTHTHTSPHTPLLAPFPFPNSSKCKPHHSQLTGSNYRHL